jgi:hypothetical protein
MRIVMMRRIMLVLAALIWVGAPVLACVPTAAMTDAEMACCKKMGGDCDMGTSNPEKGNHSCCKHTMNRAPDVADKVAQSSQVDVPLVAIAAAENIAGEIFSEYDGGEFLAQARPPGLVLELNSILRI